MTEVLEADYVVVGAGNAGMAFTDALVDHSDARVVVVDRRHSSGGHWLDAYPFVRLHQASAFYGVASTLLGGGRTQQDGPEAGLHERATAPEICSYYASVMARLVSAGRVTFHSSCEYVGDGAFTSLVSGKRYEVRGNPRIVNAYYRSPTIPADTPAPFGVADGARVIPVNDLVRLGGAASQYVIVGSGKTATDACIWLLQNGVDPDAICWVRPRDPWMLNRASIQPDRATFLNAAADMYDAAAAASSPDDFFLRLEDVGVMLRIDRSVTPTMAKVPTLAEWELDHLRSIEHVVRLGHISQVAPSRLVLQDGEVSLASDAVVVHCAADGLRYQPRVPIWGEDEIKLQPIRAGQPSLAAALVGFTEATFDSDEEKNRLCPSAPYGNTPKDWCEMQVRGAWGSAAFSSSPVIKAWVDTLALNPTGVTPELSTPAVTAALARLRASMDAGLGPMAQLAGLA